MSWTNAGKLSHLEAEKRVVHHINDLKILLIWHEDKVYAVQAQCPHLKLPLTKGQITAQGEIVCPFHKSAFDLCSGEVKCWSPWPAMLSGVLGKVSKPKNLKIYPVKVESDDIYVDI
jgi:nitrite reductase/ring-hydroxylating ferredoxin subunit